MPLADTLAKKSHKVQTPSGQRSYMKPSSRPSRRPSASKSRVKCRKCDQAVNTNWKVGKVNPSSKEISKTAHCILCRPEQELSMAEFKARDYATTMTTLLDTVYAARDAIVDAWVLDVSQINPDDPITNATEARVRKLVAAMAKNVLKEAESNGDRCSPDRSKV